MSTVQWNILETSIASSLHLTQLGFFTEISKSENLHRTSASDSSETLDPDKSKSTHRSPEKKVINQLP
jgi:hypothetical protein